MVATQAWQFFIRYELSFSFIHVKSTVPKLNVIINDLVVDPT